MKQQTATEVAIKEAAKTEFITMGYAGARMQRIAKSANINSALLHYYFRSKENLFEIVFAEAMNSIFDSINKALDGPTNSILEKITQIVSDYIDFISQYPQLPMFILTEYSYNPERIKALGNNLKTAQSFKNFAAQIEAAKEAGQIKPNVDPKNLFTDILSLTLFQFTIKPFLITAFEFPEDASFQEFIQQRKTAIANTIIGNINI
jgi:AcrR family transcriptional regulator